MAIAFRGALAGNSAGTPATTQTVTLPAGWQAGDFCLIGGEQNVASVPSFTTPAGWTHVDDGSNSASFAYCWYWRVLQAGDANPVLTSSVSGAWDWNSAAVYSAASGTLSFDAAAATVTVTTLGSTVTPGAATASQAGDASLIAIAGRAGSGTADITSWACAPPSGWVNGASDVYLVNATSSNQRMSANMYQTGLPAGSVAPGGVSFTTTAVQTFRFAATQVLVAETIPPPPPARVTAGRTSRLAETWRMNA